MINLLPRVGNVSSRFTCNSEAPTSELLENAEDMFRRYHIDSAASYFQPHAGVSPVLKGRGETSDSCSSVDSIICSWYQISKYSVIKC